MKMFRSLVLALSLGLIFSGCFYNTLNRRHYAFYYQAGLDASGSGDFALARQNFSRAGSYAEVGFLGPEAEAAALFNYSLAAGHQGDFETAERGIKRAMELDAKAKEADTSLTVLRLCELARLYQAWHKNPQARDSYEHAIPLIDEHRLHVDPIDFAVMLEDYALILERLDLYAQAQAVRVRASDLRKANPGVQTRSRIRHFPEKVQK